MKDRVPVKSGTLKKSISSKVVESGRHKVQIKIGASKFYAHMVEFGTRHSGARPFMRPAFDAEKDKAVDIFKRELKRLIERAI